MSFPPISMESAKTEVIITEASPQTAKAFMNLRKNLPQSPPRNLRVHLRKKVPPDPGIVPPPGKAVPKADLILQDKQKIPLAMPKVFFCPLFHIVL